MSKSLEVGKTQKYKSLDTKRCMSKSAGGGCQEKMSKIFLKCPKSRCTWKSDELEVELAKWMVTQHVQAEHESRAEGGQTGGVRAEKVRRPEVGPDMTNERWVYFLTRWEDYKKACGLKDGDTLLQLRECMEDGVREDHFNRFSGVTGSTEAEVLDQIKTVAVRRANRAVDRDQLRQLKQENGEAIQKFAGRVRTLACVAEYQVNCTCGKTVKYTEEVIKDQVIGGLTDREIKTDVLSHGEVNTWSLKALLDFIEGKEVGKISAGLLGTKAHQMNEVTGKKKESYRREAAGPRCRDCNRSHGRDK